MIRAAVRKGVGEYGYEFVGYRDGWRGPLTGESRPLGVPEVRGILPRGGTILGSSRTNPIKEEGGVDRIVATLERDGVDGLIAIGGEDTLGVAAKLHEAGIHVVGVPKTIDNDLGATDYTFGFDTAVNITMGSIDRLHRPPRATSARSSSRSWAGTPGWIALHSGLAGGANVILIPEHPFDLGRVCAYIQHAFESQYAPIVVVSEGAEPKDGVPVAEDAQTRFGHVRLGGIGQWLEQRDRAAHRARGPRDGAGVRPARGHADCVRPRPRDRASASTRSMRRTRVPGAR